MTTLRSSPVVVGVGGSDGSRAALTFAIEEARRRHAPLLAEAVAGRREREPDVLVREVVLRERTARALVSVALTAELLVVGHHHRRARDWLGSTTHGVLHRPGCPVAVVPVAAGTPR
ncbi:universal stress protein [Geodermatophilus sp. URMC 60]